MFVSAGSCLFVAVCVYMHTFIHMHGRLNSFSDERNCTLFLCILLHMCVTVWEARGYINFLFIFFCTTFNSCSFLLFGHDLLTTDLGVGGGALVFLEEEKRLGPPAVNKVDLPTDGLNDREAN